jgi:hypothetical protein
MHTRTIQSAPTILSRARWPAVSVPSTDRGYRDIEPDPLRSPRGGVVADLASAKGALPRLAYLSISFGPLTSPQARWAARFWEADPPPGVKPIDWIFDSYSSVTCLEDALELLDHTQGLVTFYAVT